MKSHGSGIPSNNRKDVKDGLVTRAVLFIEQTPHGELARLVKDLLHRLEPMLGFKLRVVERTGSTMKSLLSQPQGRRCDREHCITCNQTCEDTPDCTRTGVVYENVCLKCNPGAGRKGELKRVMEGAPSLYVGETSRSIEERAQEHWGAARRREEKSHMNKHQIMEHNGEQPEFIFKLISSHKTALSRQIKEAVRIRRRGGASQILNSRSEFNRCHIPRLVVEEEDEDSREQRLKLEEQTRQEIAKIMEQDDITWEEKKKREQELLKKKRSRAPDTMGAADDHNQGGAEPVDGGRKKRRKLNYAVLGEQWGEGVGGEEDDDWEPVVIVIENNQAPSPPPIKGRRGVKRSRAPTTLLNSSLITDYYQRLPRSMDSPLSPATLSFMVCSSAATDLEDRHQDPGSGMGKKTQPQDDSLVSSALPHSVT